MSEAMFEKVNLDTTPEEICRVMSTVVEVRWKEKDDSGAVDCYFNYVSSILNYKGAQLNKKATEEAADTNYKGAQLNKKATEEAAALNYKGAQLNKKATEEAAALNYKGTQLIEKATNKLFYATIGLVAATGVLVIVSGVLVVVTVFK